METILSHAINLVTSLNLRTFLGYAVISVSIIWIIRVYIKNLKILKKLVSDNSGIVNDAIEKFENSFLVKDEFGMPIVVSNKKVISIDPGAYFANNMTDMQHLSHVGSMLTALGILFTFFGIIIGLSSLDLGDAAQMQSGITRLIEGMKIAFWSSLAGIFFSIRFNRKYKDAETTMDSAIKAKLTEIDEMFIVEASSIYLRNQHDSYTRQQKFMTNMGNAASILSESTEAIKNIINPKIMSDLISKSLEGAISRELKPLFVEINDKFMILNDIKEASVDLKETNRMLAKYIQDDLQGIFTSITTALGSSKEAIDETNRAIAQTNDTMITTKESLEAQKENFVKIDGMLNSFVNDMNTVFINNNELIKSNIENVVKSSVGLIEETRENFSKVFEESNSKLQFTMQNVDEIVKRIGKVVAEQKVVEGLLKDQLGSLASTVFDNYNKVLGSLSEFSEKQQDAMNGYLKEQDEHLSNILNYLVSLSEGLNAALTSKNYEN